MNAQISDLKLRINSLVPKDVCKYLINFFEENQDFITPEDSYKYPDNKIKEDNYRCLNLSHYSLENDKFKKPLEVAQRYIEIMVINYGLHIKQKICPTWGTYLLQNTKNVRIIRYRENEFIEDHSDVFESIRGSCTLNLNEDYEGGDFRFFGGTLKETLKTGDAIIFPAEPIWIHGTEPITKGVRYSINCFLEP